MPWLSAGGVLPAVRCRFMAALRFIYSSDTNKVVVLVQSDHCRSMAKTWVSKNTAKSTKAFVKAMRLMVAPKGRRNNNNFSRPR